MADFNKDDVQALRILSLAVEFMNAERPVAASSVRSRYYPELSDDSARKAFKRDRESLAQCGIVLESVGVADGGDALWQADASLSFVQDLELSADDALLIDLLCLPVADDPSFALRSDLRIALAKIDRAYAAPSAARISRISPASERTVAVLKRCALADHAVRIDYTDADGRESTRDIAPYGLFSLRGRLYVVGPHAGGGEGAIRTYAAERISKAEELAATFERPADFDLARWRKLPFQLGPTIATCRFAVPAEHEEAVRAEVGAAGSFEEDGGCILIADAADLADAAAWAISKGAVPIEPPELVGRWRETLGKAAEHGA